MLLVWPLSSILPASFIDNRTGARHPRQLRAASWAGPSSRRRSLNSLIVGAGGMAGAMLLGVPLAVLTTRYVIRGRNLLATLAVLALVSPPFIGAYAWIMMLGRNGLAPPRARSHGASRLPSIYGFFGIILVFSLKFYPFVFLLTTSSLRTINPSLEEAAEGLGAASWQRLLRVTLPLVSPAISAGALLDLRAVDRRLRHAVDRRRPGARARDHRLQPVHQRNGRATPGWPPPPACC